MISQFKLHADHRRVHIKTLITEILMLLLCVAVMFPFYYLLVNTFKTAQDATFHPLTFPEVWTFKNYANAFEKMNFWQSFFNTVLYSALGTVLVILMGSTAAYACIRSKKKYPKFVTLYFLLGFAVPVQTTILPLFSLMRTFQLTNTYTGMLLIYSSGCTFAFFMYSGFLKTVPLELEEAAMIDGAGVYRTFWQIVFPLMQPTTLTVGIFQGIWIWNDFIHANIFLSRRSMRTLVLEVYNGMGQFRNDWALMLTIMVIVLFPIVMFYIFAQRYIIEGMVAGAIKG